MSGSLKCAYGRAQRPCVSLRHFRPAAAALQPLQPRTRAALLQERSVAEVRAASNEDAAAVAAAAAALAAAPPGADPPGHHLEAAQREQATHEILRAFLAADSSSGDGNNRGNGAHAHRTQRQRHHHHANGTAGGGGSSSKGPPVRGLQGQVVAHLLEGEFDEAFLEGVPTHTLNWAIKVGGRQDRGVDARHARGRRGQAGGERCRIEKSCRALPGPLHSCA